MKKEFLKNVPQSATENAILYSKSSRHLMHLAKAIYEDKGKEVDYNTLNQDQKDKIQGWVLGFETALEIADKANQIKGLCEVEINCVDALGDNQLVVWALGNTYPIKDQLKAMGFKLTTKWNFRINLK